MRWLGTRGTTILIKGHSFRNNSGSLATFAAIRLASSLVSIFGADLRPGSSSNKHTRAFGRS
jgi:hypothetical protein